MSERCQHGYVKRGMTVPNTCRICYDDQRYFTLDGVMYDLLWWLKKHGTPPASGKPLIRPITHQQWCAIFLMRETLTVALDLRVIYSL